MSIQTTIKDQIKDAMRAKDAVRLAVLRGLSTAFTNELVAKKRKPDEELGDDDALAVLSREAKRRTEAAEQFTNGGRPELADGEEAELVIIKEFLPAQMSREETEAAVAAKKEETGITDQKQKGALMAAVMKDLKGRADGNMVREIVDALF